MSLETYQTRRKKEWAKRAVHKRALEKKHGLIGHPKADRLYELAWDLGHSAGYHEVGIYYDQMADLLKDES